MAEELAKAGADLIIGTHTHVLQPIDLINVTLEDGATRKAVVIYALGNFCTNQHLTAGVPTDLTRYGILAQIDLAKDMHSGEAWIEDVKYEVNLCQITGAQVIRFQILPDSGKVSSPPARETIKAQYDAILDIGRYDFTAEADFSAYWGLSTPRSSFSLMPEPQDLGDICHLFKV